MTKLFLELFSFRPIFESKLLQDGCCCWTRAQQAEVLSSICTRTWPGSFQCLFTFVCLLSVVVVDVVSQCDQELFQKLISYYIMHHSDQLPKSGQKKSKYLPMKRPKQVFVKSRSKVAKLGSLISSNLVTLLSA